MSISCEQVYAVQAAALWFVWCIYMLVVALCLAPMLNPTMRRPDGWVQSLTLWDFGFVVGRMSPEHLMGLCDAGYTAWPVGRFFIAPSVPRWANHLWRWAVNRVREVLP